jgi:hypothetical protein
MARPSQMAVGGAERPSPEIPGESEGGSEATPTIDRTATFKSRSTPGPNPLLRQGNNQGWTAQMHHPVNLNRDTTTSVAS